MNVDHGDSSHPPDARPGAREADARAGTREADAASDDRTPGSESIDRRSSERLDVTWLVDCETEETFLYASIANISEMGIFVRTTKPLALGTLVTLRFSPPGSSAPYVLRGTVQWINESRPLRETPNPGMGIRFVNLTLDDRERIVDTIRTIAYLREAPVQGRGSPN